MSDAADDPQTGVVVVALPAETDPVQAIGPEQKHATLLYFGDIPGGSNPNDRLAADAGIKQLLTNAMSIVAGEFAPFTANVTGVEQLGDQGARVWMLADGTALPAIRDKLLDVDSEIASALEAVEQYPTYTPHVTVGYDQPAPDQQTQAADAPSDTVTAADLADADDVTAITFDRLALWWAGEQIETPLTGTPVAEGGSMTTTAPGKVAVREVATLAEAATGGQSGRWTVTAISAGKGSSGYYSPEVLKEAASAQLIAAGTPLFFDHASESERHDRPERSVRDIAAVFTGPATYDTTSESLVGPVQVFGPYRELVAEMAPHIGLSISGSATDIANGVIEGLARIDSVDLVTKAGRGGKFMSLLESARAETDRQAAESGAPGLFEATANDTRDALQTLLRDTYGADRTYVWVRDFAPDISTVWFEIESEDDAGLYGQTYTTNADGALALTGDRSEVQVVTTYVPATRPDSNTPTTEESKEDTMGKKEIDEAEYNRLAEADGRVDALEKELAAEKAAREAAEKKLGESGGTQPAPRNPREVLETQMREQGRQISLLRASQAARGIVAECLASGWIGEAQVVRLTNELTQESSLPLTEEGQLDEAKLRATTLARLDEAEQEAAEILASAGVGKVQGLGSTARATEVAIKQYDTELAESFAELGLSESAVDTAVKGR